MKHVKHVYTIREEDIGKRSVVISCGFFNHTIDLQSAIGYVQPQDVGKRVYRHNGIVKVENEAQKARRV